VEQRAKYANEPKKFLDSELDLDEAVRAMNVGHNSVMNALNSQHIMLEQEYQLIIIRRLQLPLGTCIQSLLGQMFCQSSYPCSSMKMVISSLEALSYYLN